MIILDFKRDISRVLLTIVLALSGSSNCMAMFPTLPTWWTAHCGGIQKPQQLLSFVSAQYILWREPYGGHMPTPNIRHLAKRWSRPRRRRSNFCCCCSSYFYLWQRQQFRFSVARIVNQRLALSVSAELYTERGSRLGPAVLRWFRLTRDSRKRGPSATKVLGPDVWYHRQIRSRARLFTLIKWKAVVRMMELLGIHIMTS